MTYKRPKSINQVLERDKITISIWNFLGIILLFVLYILTVINW